MDKHWQTFYVIRFQTLNNRSLSNFYIFPIKFEGDFRKKPLSRHFWRELRVSRSFGRVKGSKREIEDKDKGQEGDQGIKDKDRDEAEDKDGGQRRGQIERPNCLEWLDQTNLPVSWNLFCYTKTDLFPAMRLRIMGPRSFPLLSPPFPNPTPQFS